MWSRATDEHYFGGSSVAVSQCSSARPSTIRHWSYEMLVYFAPGLRGSSYSGAEHDADDVAAREHGDDGHRELAAGRRSRRRPEVRDDVRAARMHVRVVLQVALGEVLVGLVPMVALQELAHDVQHGLLVRVQRWVFVGEQRFGIGGRDDGLLGGAGALTAAVAPRATKMRAVLIGVIVLTST